MPDTTAITPASSQEELQAYIAQGGRVCYWCITPVKDATAYGLTITITSPGGVVTESQSTAHGRCLQHLAPSRALAAARSARP